MLAIRSLLLSAAALTAPIASAVPVAACYQVPVSEALRPYALFPIDQASMDKADDGTVTIGYSLPQDIAGARNPYIKLTGTLPAANGTFFTVTEDANDTTGQCVQTAAALTCMLHYAGLTFDPATTAAYLTQKYPNDPTLPQKIQVMQAFSGDGVGILSIDLVTPPGT